MWRIKLTLTCSLMLDFEIDYKTIKFTSIKYTTPEHRFCFITLGICLDRETVLITPMSFFQHRMFAKVIELTLCILGVGIDWLLEIVKKKTYILIVDWYLTWLYSRIIVTLYSSPEPYNLKLFISRSAGIKCYVAFLPDSKILY